MNEQAASASAGAPADAVIELMIKHLPPSASTLHLLDVQGRLGDSIAHRRADVAMAVGVVAFENSIDAVVLYDAALDADLLGFALRALRPGGRLIAVNPQGEPSAGLVRQLESAGYTRILVEEMLPTDAGGVLMRGEKPHVTDDTLARIRSVAREDQAQSAFKGRYLHLLICQTPNKPVWALQPGETIEWRAVALADGDDATLLAFSSLPNAVAFMQPAIVNGRIKDVNKVAKFNRAAAQDWRILLNPPLEALDGREIVLVPVDPALAEAPDE